MMLMKKAFQQKSIALRRKSLNDQLEIDFTLETMKVIVLIATYHNTVADHYNFLSANEVDLPLI